MEELNDIELILKQGISLVAIESYEEQRVMELCQRVAIKSYRNLYRWSCTDGLVSGNQLTMPPDTPTLQKPEELLTAIRKNSEAGIYVLCDFHAYFDDPAVVRGLKDVVLYSGNHISVILLSHELVLPPEIRRYSSRFELNVPSEARIRQIILEEIRQWQKQHAGQQVKLDGQTLALLTSHLRGVTESDVQRLVRGAIYDDGAITQSDMAHVNKAKFELMDMNNILSFEYDTAQFAQVGGLRGLKRWLAERKQAFVQLASAESEDVVDTPKGLMLLGVQGGGKSLAAKAIAALWQVPLLRLDMGALYNKFHGETERNLRDTLQLADNVSPCVLWMDEIEKSLSSSDTEGLSQRVLGTLLTWMAERTTPVFIVATSNDISRLPPELLRKGRLDEIFFVDLPDHNDRKTIAAIHTKKRDITLPEEALEAMANATEGFTGAEIEQAIVAAIYSAGARQQDISLKHMLKAIQTTVPISVTRAEDIESLRAWAQDRAVLANG